MNAKASFVRHKFAMGGGVTFGALLAGALLLGVIPAATAQELPSPLIWVAQENQANLTDEEVENVYWDEYDSGTGTYKRWVFACGHVTLANGATQMAVWKYRADYPEGGSPLKVGEAYFPSNPPPPAGEVHKATGIAVDSYGNVYVAGPSQRPGGTDMDICILKYDKTLQTLLWSIGYNYVNGNDIGTDIAVSPQTDPSWPGGPSALAVVVLGTSWNGSNDDLVAIALDARDSTALEVAWPNVGFGDGVRRYDYGGPDRGVEVDGLDIVYTPEGGEVTYLSAAVLGASFDPSSGDYDYVTILYGSLVPPYGPIWLERHDPSNGGDDVPTGLDVEGGVVVATGYAPHPAETSAMGAMASGPASQNLDYTTVAYYYYPQYPNPQMIWEKQWDYNGGDDYAADAAVIDIQGNPLAVVTGSAWNGSTWDAGTIVHLGWDGGPGYPPGFVGFVHGFAATGSSNDHGMAVAIDSSGLSAVLVAGRADATTTGDDDGLLVKYRWTGQFPSYWEYHWFLTHPGFGGFDAFRDVAAATWWDGVAVRLNAFTAGKVYKPGESFNGAAMRFKQWVSGP